MVARCPTIPSATQQFHFRVVAAHHLYILFGGLAGVSQDERLASCVFFPISRRYDCVNSIWTRFEVGKEKVRSHECDDCT